VTTSLSTTGSWSAALQRHDPLDLALRLSAVAVVVTAHHTPALLIAAAVWTYAVWASPRLRHHPLTWLLGAAAVTAYQITSWWEYDNHVWLTTYWMAAVGLCLLTSDPRRSLGIDGRLFVGLIFAIAALWKIFSPDFRTGDFFEYSLLQDPRFSWVADNLGGVSGADAAANDQAVLELALAPVGTEAVLTTSGGIQPIAAVFTWWGLLIESALGVLWLAPLRPRWHWLRHVALLLFAFTTYLVVPVGGFGCLLMALGATQTDDDPRWRVAYCAGFVALLIYGPIWRVLFG
jgi:hypothetical protein